MACSFTENIFLLFCRNDFKLPEPRDLCSGQYLQHHPRSVFVLAVNDDDSLEAHLLQVHSDFLARALDGGIVRRVHPVEIVVEKGDSKVMLSQSLYGVMSRRDVNRVG